MTEQDPNPTMGERLHEACWKVIEDTMAERDRALAEVRRLDGLLAEERKSSRRLRGAIDRAIAELQAWPATDS